MRRCTGPVLCLPIGVVEKPNGLYIGGEAYLSNAPSHPAGNASFIHSFNDFMKGLGAARGNWWVPEPRKTSVRSLRRV